jgi:two-component system sensor histidine kinase/response regulator
MASAETLLVRREGNDVVFLNELRHRPGPALTLHRTASDPRLPAAMVARGETGVREAVDYREVAVWAAMRAIPGSPWFMVAKVDREESYAPIRGKAWSVSVLTALRRAHDAMDGREGRALEKKKDVNKLLARLGVSPSYMGVFEESEK